MVQNQTATRRTSDPLSMVTQLSTGPVKLENLTEDDAVSIIEAARPFSGHRRDGYHMSLARGWWVNLLYYMGIQSLDVPEVLENMDPGMIVDRGGYIANHVMRLVLGNVSRLTSARVDWSVLPNTPDQIDQDGAKVGQNLLDYLSDYLELSRKRMEIALWLDIAGTAFMYANWDPTAGQIRRHYYDPFTAQPVAPSQLSAEQMQWLERATLYTEENEGDFEADVLSPFDVHVPPRFVTLDKMPWMLIRRTVSIEEIWNRYPEKAQNLPANETQTARLDQYRARIPTLARRPSLGISNSIDDDGAVDLDELWIPPSRRCPTGLFIAATQRHVFEYKAHPFAEAGMDIRYPVVDFHNIRVPGRFHSMSTVEHLVGPQTEYNRARQQVIQHRDVLSVAQWIAPVGTLSKGVVRNEMGDIMEYNPRIGRPELVSPPPLGDAQIVSGSQAQSDMQMISSFSEASLGQMPQGARSGNAVSMLQERDQAGIQPTVQELEKSFERLGTRLLQLAWKYVSYPRAVQVYGESRQADIRFFRGSDLNGNCRVMVKAGSMTPKSKAQTMEMMTALMQMGAINPADPRQQRLVLEALEVGGTDRLFLLVDGHRRRARIENQMFSKPTADYFPQVSQFDDHQAHYETHLEFMLTDEYELLNPMLKQMFLVHLNQHLEAVAQMMMAQQQAAAAVAGGPPGGGQQSKPLGKPSPPRQNASQSSNP